MTPIRQLEISDKVEIQQHLNRHYAESGQSEPHFMPFIPGESDRPKGIDIDALGKPLNKPDWQRWFVAITGQENIIGHVELKGSELNTGLHRCELGIGIERNYRGNGLGRRLMSTAIDFVTTTTELDWIDLRVFARNIGARKLYQSLGFIEIGVKEDCFRLDGEQLDDVWMALRVTRNL